METHLRNIYSARDLNLSTGRPVTAVVLPEPQHPPKVKYFPVTNNIYNNSTDCETYTSSQSEITTEYDASSEPSSREASRPSSPKSGNLSLRTVYSLTPEMAIIHRTMHDAIHTVREQQGRALTRSLLNQQKALAASKLQCNIQIKRTSTPEHPPMSNVPPRRARARLEKANGVTSGSSEESDCEPQTSRMARFQALKRRFETPTKSEEESPISQNIQKAKAFPENLLPKCHRLPVQRVLYSRTLLYIEWHSLWRWLSETITPKKTSHSVDIVHRLLMGSKVKVIGMATRRCSGLTVQWGPMFFVSFSWNLY